MKNRLISFDFLRGLAAFGIIGCHLDLTQITTGARLIKSFTDLNVGIFAMLAGFFFAASSKKFDGGGYLLSRTKRILVPYAIWSVIYIMIDLVFDILAKKPLTFQPCSIGYWVSIVLKGGASAHLWFLISLFYVQAVLSLFCKKITSSVGWIIATLFGGLGIVVVSSVMTSWFFLYPLRLLGFFLIGVSFSIGAEQIKKLPISLILTSVVAGAIIIACGYCHGFIGSCVFSVPVVLLAIVWSPKSERFSTVASLLGRASFGVYLVHIIFAIGMREIILKIGLPHNAFVFLSDQIIVWLLSMTFVIGAMRLSKHIRFFTYLFP